MIKWLMIAIRTLMMALDIIVYQVVVWMYELFMMIAETGVFSQETIQTFAGRIYALLGIFMLFKVTFSLVNYLFNPDDFTDKTKGASKLLTNFFIVLIGIISVPYIFTAAFNLQTIILKENLIGNLIMGMRPTTNSTEASDYIKQGGNNMAYTVFSGFFRPSEKLTSRECSNMPLDVQGGTAQLSAACSSFPMFQEKLNNDKTIGDTLVSAYDNRNYHELIDWGLDLATFVYNDEFVIDYTFIISTIAGGFLAWILLIFCIDIAVRSVKLGFLQIIAPIPIISYIDPKSGKDGMFNKWVKNCTSSFADLFIRLVAIYFALFIISAITSGEIIKVTTGEQQTNILVIIFIIFGALLFAKQVPQLISDLTGVKLSGGFTLNPMKKLGESPLASAAMGGALGLAGGLVANTFGGIAQTAKNIGDRRKAGVGIGTQIRKGAFDVLAAPMTGLRGGASAMFRGVTAGAGDKSGGYNAGINARQKSVQARQDRIKDQKDYALEHGKEHYEMNIFDKMGTSLSNAKVNATSNFDKFYGSSADSIKKFTGENVALDREIAALNEQAKEKAKTLNPSDLHHTNPKPLEDRWIDGDGVAHGYKYNTYADADYSAILKQLAEVEARKKYNTEKAESLATKARGGDKK